MKRSLRMPLAAATIALSLSPAAPAVANEVCTDAAGDGGKVGYACMRNEPDCNKSWGMVYGIPGPLSALGYDTGCLP